MSKDIKKSLERCVEWNCADCPNREELGSGETVCRGRLLAEVLEYVADLEAKLAESEEKLKSSWYEICPRCGNPYGASQFVRENGEVICSNCMKIEDIYEPLVNQLKQQLSESENDYFLLEEQLENANNWNKELLQEIEYYKQNDNIYAKNMSRLANRHNKDKISFAVEKLKEVKKLLEKEYRYDVEESDFAVVYEDDVDKIFDNQIKQLKEGK